MYFLNREDSREMGEIKYEGWGRFVNSSTMRDMA